MLPESGPFQPGFHSPWSPQHSGLSTGDSQVPTYHHAMPQPFLSHLPSTPAFGQWFSNNPFMPPNQLGLMPPSSEFGHSGAVPINPGFGVGGMPSIGEVGMKTRRTRSVFSKVKIVVYSVRDIKSGKNF